MRLEDLPTRTILMLDRPAPVHVEDRWKTYVPKKELTIARASNDGRGLRAEPVRKADGWCSIYSGVPIPKVLRVAVPQDIGVYEANLRRPWAKLEIGESFFAPGVAKLKVTEHLGKKWKIRFMFLNDVPGVMAWRVV